MRGATTTGGSTFGCLAAGLAVTLAVFRPLTLGVLAQGAADALAFSLGFAAIGLILALRRPANPTGWLYATVGLAGSLTTPVAPWVDQLVRDHHPLPLAAQVAAVAAEVSWAPWIALGVTVPALLLPDGRLRSQRGRWSLRTGPTLHASWTCPCYEGSSSASSRRARLSARRDVRAPSAQSGCA